MEKITLNAIGKFLAVLAVDGFLRRKHPKRFMGLMNVDTAHSVIRIPTMAVAFYGGLPGRDVKTRRAALTAIGLLYIAIGVAGAADRKVGGALPSKLTGFDIAYHFTVGAAALWLGTRAGRMMKR